MEFYHILIIIFGFIILLSLISLMYINKLLNRKRIVEIQLENVMKYIDERALLIERMINFVEENIEEEVNFINKLNDCNNTLNEIYKENKYDSKEITKSEKLLEKFKELSKIYPNLSKNEIYKILVNENEINIGRINYALANYNEKTKEYNKFKTSNKVNIFLSKLFRLASYKEY